MKLEDFKKKYANSLGWTQERLDVYEEFQRENPYLGAFNFAEYLEWYKKLKEYMETKGHYL